MRSSLSQPAPHPLRRLLALFMVLALLSGCLAVNSSPRRRVSSVVNVEAAVLPEGLKAEDVRLFIAIPAYGGNVNAVTSHNLIALALILQRLGIVFDVQFLFNESLIERARNLLVRMFLDHPSNMTHMIFIDSDIEFDPVDVVRMIGRQKEVICGVYPKKAINWDLVLETARSDPNINSQQLEERTLRYFVRPVPDRDGNVILEGGELVKATDCGTGFLLIQRSVFDALKHSYPDLKDTYKEFTTNGVPPNENSWFFFEAMVDPVSRRFLSEDYTFCKRWQDIGGEIWADLSVRLGHWGAMSLIGNPMEAMVDIERRRFRPGALEEEDELLNPKRNFGDVVLSQERGTTEAVKLLRKELHSHGLVRISIGESALQMHKSSSNYALDTLADSTPQLGAHVHWGSAVELAMSNTVTSNNAIEPSSFPEPSGAPTIIMNNNIGVQPSGMSGSIHSGSFHRPSYTFQLKHIESSANRTRNPRPSRLRDGPVKNGQQFSLSGTTSGGPSPVADSSAHAYSSSLYSPPNSQHRLSNASGLPALSSTHTNSSGGVLAMTGSGGLSRRGSGGTVLGSPALLEAHPIAQGKDRSVGRGSQLRNSLQGPSPSSPSIGNASAPPGGFRPEGSTHGYTPLSAPVPPPVCPLGRPVTNDTQGSLLPGHPPPAPNAQSILVFHKGAQVPTVLASQTAGGASLTAPPPGCFAGLASLFQFREGRLLRPRTRSRHVKLSPSVEDLRKAASGLGPKVPQHNDELRMRGGLLMASPLVTQLPQCETDRLSPVLTHPPASNAAEPASACQQGPGGKKGSPVGLTSISSPSTIQLSDKSTRPVGISTVNLVLLGEADAPMEGLDGHKAGLGASQEAMSPATALAKPGPGSELEVEGGDPSVRIR